MSDLMAIPESPYGKPDAGSFPPEADPAAEGTRPNRPAGQGASARQSANAVARAELAWAGVGLVVLLFCAASALLVLPPLLNPLPGQPPGYDIAAFQGAAATMVPGEDALLETLQGRFAVYVPRGAYAGEATLVILPRPAELVPRGTDTTVERFDAVDVSLSSPLGQPLISGPFDPPILVCYALDEPLKAKREADPASVTVQSYSEDGSTGDWVDLPPTPGWLPHQVCGTASRLSLFALGVRAQHVPHSIPTPSGQPLEPYGVPLR